MTSRRIYEQAVWSHLAGYVNASLADELGIEDYDALSEAAQGRVDKAIERVFLRLCRNAG